jgi:hypothetical protein
VGNSTTAYAIVEAGLIADPERCRRYGLFGDYDKTSRLMAQEWRIATDALHVAVESAGRRLRISTRRSRPPDSAWWEAFLATIQGPEPFSPDAVKALVDESPAATWCRADLKQQLNLLRRPPAQAAELYRILHLYWATNEHKALRQVLTARQLSELRAAQAY